ncbi:MAG: ABC transporter substrate-binding protein [Rhodobacteraceae bacterium]|nr:ABC transporter substrate-binding protein [Paracoccaceae bacterium]
MNIFRLNSRRVLLCWALLFAPVNLAFDTATAETPLRLAIGTVPAARNNPHDSASMTRLWLYAAVYDTLTFITREGDLQPWLARGWRADGPASWIFDLRDDVHFSNGKPFVAQDVADTIEYLQSDTGAAEAVATYVSGISNVQVIDDHTIRLTSGQPEPMLPRKLSLVRIATTPGGKPRSRQELIESGIGTGPYRIESWRAGGGSMSAVENGWRRAPTKNLEVTSILDPISRRNAMTTGRVDIAAAAFQPYEAVDTSGLPYDIQVDPIPAVVGIAFNTARNIPLRDVRVRRAIDLAIDKATIIDTLFSGLAPLAAQPARREFFGFDPTLTQTPYDPELARRLLDEAGYAAGFELSMTLSSGATVWDQIFQAVAADLRKLNVILTIDMLPEPVLAEYHYQKGYPVDAFGTAFFAPAFDALDVMKQHSCEWPVAWYCDPGAMPLIEVARSEPNLEKREELTRAVMRYAHDTTQGIFLYESIGLVGFNRRIKNFRSDFGFYRYELMTVDD